MTEVQEPKAGQAETKGRSFRFPKESAITFTVFAIVWQISSYFLPDYAVPGLPKIYKAFLGLPIDFVLITMARMMGALAVSFAVGMAVAVAMYSSRAVEAYLLPMIRLLMAVPAVCWVVFSVLWFTGVEFRIIFVLVIVCGPVFVIDILDGMKGVSVELREMLRSFRPGWLQMFTKLIVPGTLPIILTSWKINLTLAVRVVTIAELVGAVSGIGYGLVIAQELFSVAEVFAWSLVLVIVLFMFQAVVNVLERTWLAWRT